MKHPFCEHDAITPGYGCSVCGCWRFSEDLLNLQNERDDALANLSKAQGENHALKEQFDKMTKYAGAVIDSLDAAEAERDLLSAKFAELEAHNFKQRCLLRDLWHCPDCLRHFTGDGMAYPYSESCKCESNPHREAKDEVRCAECGKGGAANSGLCSRAPAPLTPLRSVVEAALAARLGEIEKWLRNPTRQSATAVNCLHIFFPEKEVTDKSRPVIVCLCGSTRFWREFQEASLRETLEGRIVLSIGAARCADGDDKRFGGYIPVDEYDRVKIALDGLHLQKIELADEVLILNVGGYIGQSTRNELNHAISLGKKIRYLEGVNPLRQPQTPTTGAIPDAPGDPEEAGK